MSDNVTLISSLYDAFGRGDIPFILRYMADHVEWICEGPSALPFCGTFSGPQGVLRFFKALATTQTGQRLSIEDIFGEGDKVASAGRYSGTVTATGKPFDMRVAHIFTVREGRVVRCSISSIPPTSQLPTSESGTRLHPVIHYEPWP